MHVRTVIGIFLFAVVILQPVAAKYGDFWGAKNDGTPIFKGPDAAFGVVTTINQGDIVKQESSKIIQGYMQVVVPDFYHATGYVLEESLELIDDYGTRKSTVRALKSNRETDIVDELPSSIPVTVIWVIVVLVIIVGVLVGALVYLIYKQETPFDRRLLIIEIKRYARLSAIYVAQAFLNTQTAAAKVIKDIQAERKKRSPVKAERIPPMLGVAVVLTVLVITGLFVLNSNTDSISEEEDKSVVEKIPDGVMVKINKNIGEQVISKLAYDSVLKDLADKYPVLKNTKQKINLFPETIVYLYYSGLPSGSIWDKPGAKAFGGNLITTVSFSSGPVKAKLFAHVELEGNRNYFFVETNRKSGWMGRPYINKDKQGKEFFMPNPITSESVRENTIIDSKIILSNYTSNKDRYIPSYNEIDWDPSIPHKYRQSGYDMYRSALDNGYSQVDSLVNQYLMTH